MGECVLKNQNRCGYSIERGKCTIHDWCVLYEPPHQFQSPNFFLNGHCEKD